MWTLLPAVLAIAVVERPDLGAVFAEQGTPGTFVLYEPRTARLTVVDRARAARRYVPASTFKIANSLIALETGAVKDEREVIPYGGKPQPFPQWERDMDMRDAIRVSNVPVYQEIARRIGRRRMLAQLERLGYGNRRMGPVVDRFWLDGPLQISAMEQARFVAGLAEGKLPLSQRSQRVVRDILRVEEKDGATLFGKTGWASGPTPPQIGWWVGWVEREGLVYAFALNIDMASADDTPRHRPVPARRAGCPPALRPDLPRPAREPPALARP
jgi:beta-lactamase class D